MIGQDAQADIVLLVVSVGPSADGLGRVEHRQEQVGGKDGVDALQQREDALEAGAGVDARPGQRRGGAVRGAVVLHEYEVPDLHEPLVAAERRATVVPVGRALVEEELRAGPAGTGVPHVPEVVLPQSLDARSGNADGIPPDLLGLVVALVDGDPHPVAVDAQHLGDQLPSKGDGLGLEVVAEAEVPEHLEERAVSVGGADDVDVLGPEALLDRGGT